MSLDAPSDTETPHPRKRLHYAWVALAITFLALIVAAGVRSAGRDGGGRAGD